MSYSTDFYGEFSIEPVLDQSLANKINALWNDGGSGTGFDGLLPEHVSPPSVYCPWRISKTLDALMIPVEAGEWNHNDHYIEWLCIILKYFLADYSLNGTVTWCGEDFDEDSGDGDTGELTLVENYFTGVPDEEAIVAYNKWHLTREVKDS